MGPGRSFPPIYSLSLPPPVPLDSLLVLAHRPDDLRHGLALVLGFVLIVSGHSPLWVPPGGSPIFSVPLYAEPQATSPVDIDADSNTAGHVNSHFG